MEIIILLFFMLIFAFIFSSIVYFCNIPSGNPVRIKFKDFKKYYLINPNRWNLYYNYVSIYTSSARIFGKKCYFNYLDTLKYRFFRHNLLNKKRRESLKEDYVEILEAVQQDINNLRKQANKEIEHGAKQSIDIQKRLEEDIKLKC